MLLWIYVHLWEKEGWILSKKKLLYKTHKRKDGKICGIMGKNVSKYLNFNQSTFLDNFYRYTQE